MEQQIGTAKKHGTGFGLRLTLAIILLALVAIYTVILTVLAVGVPKYYSSLVKWRYERGNIGREKINVNGEEMSLYFDTSDSLYIRVGNTEYRLRDENMQAKTLTFANEAGVTKVIPFEATGWYWDFERAYASDRELYTVLFLGALLPVALLGILQTIFAVAAKKRMWAVVGSIIIGSICAPIYGLGALGIVGGIRSESYCKNRAKRQALEKEDELSDVKSVFTGGAFANALINWVSRFVTMVTLGIAYPFMVCWKLKWIAEHTFIDNRQQTFDGNGLQYFGQYILIWFLSAITLGIYYILCASIAMEKWRTSHTHFMDSGATIAADGTKKPNQSSFDGHWYQLLCVTWLCRIVKTITLSFGQYWAHCYMKRWRYKHTTIDGERLKFNGRAMQYFGKRILWLFLTGITFGIFIFWLKIKSLKWTVKHTHIRNNKCDAENENTARQNPAAAEQLA